MVSPERCFALTKPKGKTGSEYTYIRKSLSRFQARQDLRNETSKPNDLKEFWRLKRFADMGRYLVCRQELSRAHEAQVGTVAMVGEKRVNE